MKKMNKEFLAVLIVLLTSFNLSIAQDLWQTNPKECAVLQDTLNAKMTMVTLVPGAVLQPHTHHPFMVYVLEGGMLETATNGTSTKFELTTGLHFKSPEMGVHSDKNIGKTTIKFLLVEIINKK